MLMPKTMHPTSRVLLCYLDGELPVDDRREVAAHLKECEGCRAELDGIEADLDWHLVLDAASQPSYAPPRAEGMQRLLCAMRDWRQSNEGVAAAAAREQAAGETADIFLGAAGADAMATPDRAEALFSAFLGRRAASNLIRDVRSTVKVERLAPHLS